MIVEVQAAQPPRVFGTLEGIEQIAKAVIGAAPEVGVDVLVDDGRIELQAARCGADEGIEPTHRRLGAGDVRVAAVHVEQAIVVGELEGGGVRLGITGPEHHLHRLLWRGQPFVDVARRTDDLPGEIDLVVAGDLHHVAVLGFEVLALLGDRRLPEERVAEGMGGHLHLGIGEQSTGDGLQLCGQLRVAALGADLALDDRRRGQKGMRLDEPLQHDLTGIGRAGYFGLGREGVTVDMHRSDPAAVFRGRVGHRQGGELQRLGGEDEGVDDPATGFGAVFHHVGGEGETAPAGHTHGHEALTLAGEGDNRGRSARQRLHGGQAARPQLDRRLEVAGEGRVRHLQRQVVGQGLATDTQAQPLEQGFIVQWQSTKNQQRRLFVQALADPVAEGPRVGRRATGHPDHHASVEGTGPGGR